LRLAFRAAAGSMTPMMGNVASSNLQEALPFDHEFLDFPQSALC
jgi:hypothetical protein